MAKAVYAQTAKTPLKAKAPLMASRKTPASTHLKSSKKKALKAASRTPSKTPSKEQEGGRRSRRNSSRVSYADMLGSQSSED